MKSAESKDELGVLSFDYRSEYIGNSLIIHADCFEWLGRIQENTLHAIVTDPPYGVKEYDFDQIEKRANGNGGIWRIPPSFDGHVRQPLPRFTALNAKERTEVSDFFFRWGRLATSALRPSSISTASSRRRTTHMAAAIIITVALQMGRLPN